MDLKQGVREAKVTCKKTAFATVLIVNTLKLALMDLIIHSRVPTVLMVNQGSAKGLRFRVTNIFGKFANQLSPTRGATGKF